VARTLVGYNGPPPGETVVPTNPRVNRLVPPWPTRRGFCRALGTICIAALAATCSDSTPTSASSSKSSTPQPFGSHVIAVEVPLRRMYVGGSGNTSWTNYVSFTNTTQYTGDASSFDDVVVLYQAGYLLSASGTGFVLGSQPNVNAVVTAVTLDIHKSGPVYVKWQYPAEPPRRDLFGGIPTVPYFTGRALLLVPPGAAVDPASPIPSLDALTVETQAGKGVCVTADTIEVATLIYRATSYSMRPTDKKDLTCR